MYPCRACCSAQWRIVDGDFSPEQHSNSIARFGVSPIRLNVIVVLPFQFVPQAPCRWVLFHPALEVGPEMAPHNDQLTRVITHVPCFCSIHRWLPRVCLGVESSGKENVVL